MRSPPPERTAEQLGRVAAAGMVVLPVAYAATLAFAAIRWPSGPGPVWVLVAATAVYTVLLVGLLVGEVWQRPVPGRVWVLAGIVSAVGLATPSGGEAWVVSYFAPATAAALVLRPLPAFVGGAVAGTAAWAVSAPASPVGAIYTVQALGVRVGSILILVWMVRTLHRLRAARELIAAEAVAAQRHGLEDVLQGSVGKALEQITEHARVAERLVPVDRDAARNEVAAMVQLTREAAAEARSTVRRYGQCAIDDDLDGAGQLLRAAGIAVSIVGHPGELGGESLAMFRSSLRTAVADALHNPAIRAVTLRIGSDGRVQLDTSTSTTASAATGAGKAGEAAREAF